jgi:hypothetical protein
VLLIAILARQVALIREIQNQRLEREIGRRIVYCSGYRLSSDEHAGTGHLFDHIRRVRRADPMGHQMPGEFFARLLTVRDLVDNGSHGIVQFENSATRDEIEKAPAAAGKSVKLTQAVRGSHGTISLSQMI